MYAIAPSLVADALVDTNPTMIIILIIIKLTNVNILFIIKSPSACSKEPFDNENYGHKNTSN